MNVEIFAKYTALEVQMKPKKRSDEQLEFQRAVIILYRNLHTVDDFLKYWSFSGPCREDHPKIEDI